MLSASISDRLGMIEVAGNAMTGKQGEDMRIRLTSVYVDDQDKALAFYTEVLGFVLLGRS